MAVEGYELKASQFEELLQKISTTITADAIFERLAPAELWRRSENYVTSLRNIAEHLRDMMLLIKPERAPTIRSGYKILLQPLDKFQDTLVESGPNNVANSGLALEHLRNAVVEGTNFLDLVKETKNSASESISEILKLKEIYQSKSYLSRVSVPEVVYARFDGLKREMENLKIRLTEIERMMQELARQIDVVETEMVKFQTESSETPVESTNLEPALVSEKKDKT